MMAAAVAAPMRIHRSAIHVATTLWATRNQTPAAIALDTAARMLIRWATVGAIGSSANTRPRSTKKGLPGGWGSPSPKAAAMYSPASHIDVVGESVRRYITSTQAVTTPAALYGGGVISAELMVGMGSGFARAN